MAVEIINCIIKDNKAEEGGGVYHSRTFDGTFTIKNCSIINNFATDTTWGGGGIYTSDNCTIDSCIITDNKVTYSNPIGGGGILVTGNENVSITNCFISNNEVLGGRGGGVYFSYSTLENPLVNNTIINNKAGDDGGVHAGGGKLAVVNCIIWGNSPNSIGGDELEVYNSNVQGGLDDIESVTVSAGNIDSDPKFYQGYQLSFGSPCINTGTNSYFAEYLPVTDIGNDERPLNGQYDMGADEVMVVTLGDIISMLRALSGNTVSGIFYIDADEDSKVSMPDIVWALRMYSF